MMMMLYFLSQHHWILSKDSIRHYTYHLAAQHTSAYARGLFSALKAFQQRLPVVPNALLPLASIFHCFAVAYAFLPAWLVHIMADFNVLLGCCKLNLA